MAKEQELIGPSVCNHCGNKTVFKLQKTYLHRYEEEDMEWWVEYVWQLSECLSCSKPTLWQGRIDSDKVSYTPNGDIYYYIWVELYPGSSKVPEPAIDMPADIKKDYKEAGDVLPYSPRASAALLRLVIQKLCKHLGQPTGKSIYEDIADLVKAGLSPKVQQALDSVRVIGNQAVHPGEIDLNDNPEIALTLFKLVNFIVEEMITRPREIKEIYNFLPQKQRDGIRGRDKNSLGHTNEQQE